MKIIELEEKYEKTYFNCLEDWSDEIKEAGDHKKHWYAQMKDKGLGVKLALTDDDIPCGMIQYLPVEYSNIDGKDLYFVCCIWVHGYKEGVGNHQKKGIGKALLQAAEEDVRNRGRKGLVAWGISLPFWMKASWFKKQGYKKVDKDSMQVLLWKPFSDDAQAPKLIRAKKKPQKEEGKVKVTSFINGWCPAQNLVFERARRAVSEFKDKALLEEIHTNKESVFQEWGISDALFIDGKAVRTGPPPSYDKIKRKIAKRVRKLR